jgi:hypothetical protein
LQSEARFVTIDVTFKDGSTLSKRQNTETRLQLTVEEVYSKFMDNGRLAGMSEKNISEMVNIVKTLENCEDVSKLVDLVCEA